MSDIENEFHFSQNPVAPEPPDATPADAPPTDLPDPSGAGDPVTPTTEETDAGPGSGNPDGPTQTDDFVVIEDSRRGTRTNAQ